MRALGILLILLLVTSVLVAAMSPRDRELMDKALALREAMLRGNYKVVTVSTFVSNGRHYLRQELRAATDVFRLTVAIPAQAQPRARPNTIYLMGGSTLWLHYSRQLIGPLSVIGGPGWKPGEMMWSVGIGYSFGTH